MAKRFTETKIWDDPWFQDLPVKYKLLWKYVCDNCGIAGEWLVNQKLAEFRFGAKIDLQEALCLFNSGKDRVLDCGGIWLLLQFIEFQYGKLTPEKVPFHRKVQEKISDLSSKATLHSRVHSTLQDKEEDKDKDKDIGIGQGKGQEEEGVGETKTWRNDFSIYQAEAKAALNDLLNDAAWIAERESYHPGQNIQLSLQKSWNDFWLTEAGWQNKKSKKTKAINWKGTANDSLSRHKVWMPKKNTFGPQDVSRDKIRQNAEEALRLMGEDPEKVLYGQKADS